mgnify:CR=1 FL=1
MLLPPVNPWQEIPFTEEIHNSFDELSNPLCNSTSIGDISVLALTESKSSRC